MQTAPCLVLPGTFSSNQPLPHLHVAEVEWSGVAALRVFRSTTFIESLTEREETA